MTQDEIIAMAKEAGCEIRNGHIYNQYTGSLDQMLKRFTKLVAAHEREACAKLLDEEAIDAFTFDDSLARATESYAELIRARGQQ